MIAAFDGRCTKYGVTFEGFANSASCLGGASRWTGMGVGMVVGAVAMGGLI